MSSKYPDAIPVTDICSISVTMPLLEIFSRMGFPGEVQGDLGTSFAINLTTEDFEKFWIKGNPLSGSTSANKSGGRIPPDT
ncbi:hypothetical protein CEXT_266591 [Caerostris extrusa]|uniref:Uncharacterized protein n=1 Tax=Caerostris extrusa TaxID=172846 RepID=A0AAV4WIZ1_CAEEX|nr:hypothetical protein CEXT_266591 [Caerostris extrusa]